MKQATESMCTLEWNELPDLTVNVQRPCVLLRAATDFAVLRTACQGPSRVLHLRRESERTSGHISVGTCLKEEEENVHDN
jgi:hypothetical protein